MIRLLYALPIFLLLFSNNAYAEKKCIGKICTGHYHHYVMNYCKRNYNVKVLKDDVTEEVVYIWKGNTGYKLIFKCNMLTDIKKEYIFQDCDCSKDRYNCKDFRSKIEAQKCYDYCYKLTGSDVHKLDRDKDGLACER